MHATTDPARHHREGPDLNRSPTATPRPYPLPKPWLRSSATHEQGSVWLMVALTQRRL
ncbi:MULTISPECIES: hypothetical protein [unclassified Streptomyces]|uniref:hypothetical protein n=1 Tax=unclassified Streptomyces TaxID=2593676 RepID=UPI002E2A5B3C|nr:hypothetical protein [Streptomyces sp. NBC_01439]